MRNLKKVLCLVLSLAMMLSVMVMGTGAVYTDQASIKNTEAVDVLTALNILEGYQDGSFRPNKVVTRAEMAKIITFILNGGNGATIGSADVSTFSDMNGHWALNEVEYCVSKGIIDGYPNGTFRPENTVTGTEAAKMLLTALNYDGTIFGYVGNNWAINVNVDAAKAGLYEDMTGIDPSQGMARDNIAQMVYNMLGANLMEKHISRVVNGDITYSYSESKVTAMEKFFGANSDAGILVDIWYNKDKGEYTYTIALFDSFDKWGTPEFAYDWDEELDTVTVTSKTDYSDLFGMNVTALSNASGKLYGLYLRDGGVITSGVWADVEDKSNDYSNSIKIGDDKYRLDNVAKSSYGLDYRVIAYNNFDFGVDEYGNPFTPFDFYQKHHRVMPQYSFTAIDWDGGDDIDLFVVYPYFVMKSTKSVDDDYFRVARLDEDDGIMRVGVDTDLMADPFYQDEALIPELLPSNSNGTFVSGTGTEAVEYDADVEYEDVQVNGTIAAKDTTYLMAIPAKYTAQGEDIYTVLDVQNDKATQMKSNDVKIKLGDTWQDGTLLTDKIVRFKDLSNGENYSYVEYNSFLFMIDGENGAPTAEDYVVVTDRARDTSGGVKQLIEATLLFSDGKEEDVWVTVKNAGPVNRPEIGCLYTYEVNKDGNYELTKVPMGYTDEDTSFKFEQAYKYNGPGAPLNREIYEYDSSELGFVKENKQGVYATGLYTATDDYNFEDDAVVFAYNVKDDDYCVITGKQLNDVYAGYWSYIAVANNGKGNPTVEMAYVVITEDPGNTYKYAYLNEDAIRSISDASEGKDGLFSVSVTAYTKDGKETFNTKLDEDEITDIQNNVYNVYDEVFAELTFDDEGYLINITVLEEKAPWGLVDSGTYWDAEILGEFGNGDRARIANAGGTTPYDYFKDADTEFIASSGSEKIGPADFEQGSPVWVVWDLDDGEYVIKAIVLLDADDRLDTP